MLFFVFIRYDFLVRHFQDNRQVFPVSDTKVQVLFHSSFAVRLKYAKQIKYFFVLLTLHGSSRLYYYYRNNMLFFLYLSYTDR